MPGLWSKEIARKIVENSGLYIPQYRPGALSPNTPEGDEIDAMLTVAGVRATPGRPSGQWKDLYKDVLGPPMWELHLGDHTMGPRRLRSLDEWRAAVSELLEQVNG